MQVPKRFRIRLLKSILGTALAWILFEFLVLPTIPRHLGLAHRAHLPAPMFLIGQRSIQQFPPRDYVLYLGDSNAEGWGDWLSTVIEEGGDPAFNAADLAAAAADRDILNLGSGGASSVSGTAFLVEKRFAALARFGLGDPDGVIVQFYAGNDIDGNIDDFARDTGALDSSVAPASYVAQRAEVGRLQGRFGTLLLPYMVSNALRGQSAGLETQFKAHPWVADDGSDPERENVVRVGAARYRFEGSLENPAVLLSEQELALGLDLLEASVAWVRARFPAAAVAVAYVPAPTCCYELVTGHVLAKSVLPREPRTTRAAVAARAEHLRRAVAEIAHRQGARFLDATEPLRRAGREQLVHGPRDAFHLNRRGYEVLAGVIEPWVREVPRSNGLQAARGSSAR